MSAKGLMLLGGLGGIALMLGTAFAPTRIDAVVMFALGAIFGKGYGIWEERARRAPIDDGEAREDG